MSRQSNGLFKITTATPAWSSSHLMDTATTSTSAMGLGEHYLFIFCAIGICIQSKVTILSSSAVSFKPAEIIQYLPLIPNLESIIFIQQSLSGNVTYFIPG